MQRSLDKSGCADDHAIRNWTAIILTLHAVIFLTLVGLALGYPGASEWISAAMQAEFVNTAAPSAAPAQIAHPVGQMQSVRTN